MNFDKFKKLNDDQVNVGVMEDATVVTTYKNEACGDDYFVYLKVENDTIVDASFTTSGCGFGMAALSLCVELAKGRTLDEAEKITTDEIEEGVEGFPPRRLEYPKTAIEVLHRAIAQVREQAQS